MPDSPKPLWPDTRLLDLFGLTHPIIQAPMAGVSSTDMAIAAANAGCMGSLGCAMTPAPDLANQLRDVATRTNGPVNFNFFVHQEPDLAAFDDTAIRTHLQPAYDEAGLGPVPAPKSGAAAFNDATLDILLARAPKIVSFHFGLPEPHVVAALKERGVKLIGCATSIAEAKALEVGGMDAIVAQGAEAGGHRGSFIGEPHLNDMGTMALVPLLVDAVRVPIIAAGGIFDGRGIAAAFMLGASGVQIGTAFMRATEATTHPLHRQALATRGDAETRLTRLFSGRPARALRNRLTDEWQDMEDFTAPFPAQRSLITPLAKAALGQGKLDFHNMWSGQTGCRAEEKSTTEIIENLVTSALTRLAI
ncbi:MAG: nitronate monooxygenase [Parvibaculum sp.]